MPCDTALREGQTLEARNREVGEALARLQRMLGQGLVRVRIGPRGAALLEGWPELERAGLSDACALRVLTYQNSWELRRAIAAAEARDGQRYDPRASTVGWHSHDQGKTWGRH